MNIKTIKQENLMCLTVFMEIKKLLQSGYAKFLCFIIYLGPSYATKNLLQIIRKNHKTIKLNLIN